MKITLKDGSVFEGTAEEYAEFVKLVEGLAERPSVGDLVKVIEKGTHHANVGDVLKIVEDEKDAYPFLCKSLDSDMKSWFRESQVVKIEAKDEYVPKVGDKVRALADSEFYDIEEGEIGVVTSVDAPCGDFDKYSIAVRTGEERCYFRPQDLELVAVEAKEEKPLKVGDNVVALPTADEKYSVTTTEMQLGKVIAVQDDLIRIEILAHSKGGGFVGEDFYVESKYFRKATDEEVTKIEDKEEDKPKQGDIVVITGNTSGSRNKVGDIGKVGNCCISGGVQVEVPSRPASEGVAGNYTKLEEMRPATEEEKEKYYAELHKSEFKAGDYAKVIKKTHEFDEGDIVKISKTDTEGYTSSFDFRVDFVSVTGKTKLRGQDCGFIDAENIVKIGEEESESIAKWSAIGRKPGEFKKGDIVRGHRYDDEMSKFTGEVEDVSDGMIGVIDFDYKYHAANKDDCELVAPVESRVDRVD